MKKILTSELFWGGISAGACAFALVLSFVNSSMTSADMLPVYIAVGVSFVAFLIVMFLNDDFSDKDDQHDPDNRYEELVKSYEEENEEIKRAFERLLEHSLYRDVGIMWVCEKYNIRTCQPFSVDDPQSDDGK